MKQIFFTTEMVKAILEGRKMQTRRVIKNITAIEFLNNGCLPSYVTDLCQYQIWDILWIREAWNYDPHENVTYIYKEQGDIQCNKWKSSRFMPLEAARIFLEVTNIRVERLKDISEQDAIAEGYSYESWQKMNEDYGIGLDSVSDEPIHWYLELWDSINFKKYPWSSNPWIWVINFKRVKP